VTIHQEIIKVDYLIQLTSNRRALAPQKRSPQVNGAWQTCANGGGALLATAGKTTRISSLNGDNDNEG
jgi:hypothetical protein